MLVAVQSKGRTFLFRMKICVLGDELHCDEAKQLKVEFQTIEDLGKYKKDKKMVKKLGMTYSSLPSQSSQG